MTATKPFHHACFTGLQLIYAAHHVKRFCRRKVTRILRSELQSMRQLPLHLVKWQGGIDGASPRATDGQKERVRAF